MTVIENLRFAQTASDENFLKELLEIVGLTKHTDKYPALLSGGQNKEWH